MTSSRQVRRFNIPPAGSGGCSCGKVNYSSRAQAKDARKRLDRTLDAYACPDGTGYWHLGHSTAWAKKKHKDRRA